MTQVYSKHLGRSDSIALIEEVLVSVTMAENSSSASAGQPVTTHPGSVKTGGTWDVYILQPFEDKYSYTWQGKEREGANICCTLVCAQDTRQYCHAKLKKTNANATKYEKIQASLKPGARFHMSKASFADDAKSAYVSASLKTVVDLSNTTMSLCLTAPDSAVHPSPTATVAGSSGLQNNQLFDITALVQDVTETRTCREQVVLRGEDSGWVARQGQWKS